MILSIFEKITSKTIHVDKKIIWLKQMFNYNILDAIDKNIRKK